MSEEQNDKAQRPNVKQRVVDREWPLPHAEPEEVGMSSERLARIRPAMQRFVDEGKDPGFVTLVARKGKVVDFEAQGYMDIESKRPVRKDTIYRLFSNTKPIAGVATMICVEEGLLKLDDPLSKFIPAFKNQVVPLPDPSPPEEMRRNLTPPGVINTVPARRATTIRDCLRNTTGFISVADVPMSYRAKYKEALDTLSFAGMNQSVSIEETVQALAKLPLDSQPGTRFTYHVGYPILGRVLEIVTGMTLTTLLEERIFKPLGMTDSSFYLPEEKTERFATLYRPKLVDDRWTLVVGDWPQTSDKVKGPKTYFDAGGGAGGVLSTVADYARFAQMLLNGGRLDGVRILGRKTVEMMTCCHTPEDMAVTLAGPGFGFGMGVGVYKGVAVPQLRSAGTYGWWGVGGTACYVDPKEEMVWLCFTQVMYDQAFDNYPHEEFERLVYQSLE